MVANDFRERGQEAKAEDYLKKALRDQENLYQQYLKVGGFDSKLLKKQIEKGKELLAGYRYVADTDALEETVSYLERTTGLPVMSNKVGQQKNEDFNQVISVMGKFLDLKIPYVVWFRVEIPGFSKVRSLIIQTVLFVPTKKLLKIS